MYRAPRSTPVVVAVGDFLCNLSFSNLPLLYELFESSHTVVKIHEKLYASKVPTEDRTTHCIIVSGNYEVAFTVLKPRRRRDVEKAPLFNVI